MSFSKIAGLMEIYIWASQGYWGRWSRVVVLNGPGIILFAYSLPVVLIHLGFPWRKYLSVQSLASVSMISICTWWVRNVCCFYSTILSFCNRVESSKITNYFGLSWTKYFQFGWQNASTWISPPWRQRLPSLLKTNPYRKCKLSVSGEILREILKCTY